jgi:hypothetical protein
MNRSRNLIDDDFTLISQSGVNIFHALFFSVKYIYYPANVRVLFYIEDNGKLRRHYIYFNRYRVNQHHKLREVNEPS